MNAVKADPLAFANIHDEYGNALEQSGEGGQAAEAHATANALREENPGRRAEFTPARYKCAVPRTGQSAGTG